MFQNCAGGLAQITWIFKRRRRAVDFKIEHFIFLYRERDREREREIVAREIIGELIKWTVCQFFKILPHAKPGSWTKNPKSSAIHLKIPKYRARGPHAPRVKTTPYFDIFYLC